MGPGSSRRVGSQNANAWKVQRMPDKCEKQLRNPPEEGGGLVHHIIVDEAGGLVQAVRHRLQAVQGGTGGTGGGQIAGQAWCRRVGGLLSKIKGAVMGGLKLPGGHARQSRAGCQHGSSPEAVQERAVQCSRQYKRTSKKMDVAEIFLVSVW
jgi:hypothetical protein